MLINRSSCANWKPLGKFPSHLNPALSTISPHSHIFTMDRWMQHWVKKKNLEKKLQNVNLELEVKIEQMSETVTDPCEVLHFEYLVVSLDI